MSADETGAPTPSTTTRISAVTDTATTAGPISLPPELLAEASRRLGWAALLYAGTYALAHFGPLLISWLTVPGHPFWRTQNIVAGVSISVAVAMFVLARRATLPPQQVLNLGLVFEVVAAFGISIAEFWKGFPPIARMDGEYLGIPWECAWILIFPLIAPNTPRNVLVASLATATTGPITVLFTTVLGADFGRPPVVVAAFFLFTTYLCAIVAYVIARLIYRYSVRLKNAREIGSYELVRKLGEGGMGEVWVGRHRMLARPAAVKLIRPEFLGDSHHSRATAIKRFEREARATAALRSTHTIHIYDFGVTEEGAFFYVMEFLEGLTLDAMVRRFGPISASRTVYLLRQVCHSLGEAHARDLIHRDIKPANIFTSRLGPDCDFVKVLDFGLVKHTTEEESATALTGQGITAGTPAYMAPEIALGKPDIDGRADLYSLGCVGYWLLTGHPVFAGDTPLATALAHVRDTPVPPSQRGEISIPAALDALILSCLAKAPAHRPQTAMALLQELDHLDVAPWTEGEARKWWAMHGPLGALSSVTDPDLSAAEIMYAKR